MSVAENKDPGKNAPMGIMYPGREMNDIGNVSQWTEHAHKSTSTPNIIENNKWEAAAVCISVPE